METEETPGGNRPGRSLTGDRSQGDAMISNRTVIALVLVAVLAVVASPAAAQYMFLGTNGDGFRTSADHLLAGSQTVNVYLNTNHKRDGSLALCYMKGRPP